MAQVRQNKGSSLLQLPKDFTLIDIETTGLSPVWDDIIEISALKCKDYKVVDDMSVLIKPASGELVSDFIENLTGITNDMLSKAGVNIEDALTTFNDFIGDDILVGHNVNFDINMLYDNFESVLDKPLVNDFVDTLRLARIAYPDLKHHRLGDMIDFLNLKMEHQHRAFSDVISNYELFLEIKNVLGSDWVKPVKKRVYKKLDYSTLLKDETLNDVNSPLYKKKVCITGKLNQFIKQEALQIVTYIGGEGQGTVTRDTDYLVLGNQAYQLKDGKSGKHKKALELQLKGQDITIISEDVFMDMINDYLNGL